MGAPVATLPGALALSACRSAGPAGWAGWSRAVRGAAAGARLALPPAGGPGKADAEEGAPAMAGPHLPTEASSPPPPRNGPPQPL
ncbi:unnamed protein product [Rangifer tarandus platyrhynchus]|uniref:Uncharacterized protein n=2 Tax=Rangifer tarandus platyrhynchus TaxID=3082113 RepID=A0ABN8ZSI9_RANTA|nr:unnamed protein product [Rangifer tarandus platyrhynchus]CAI9710479.1 unnamed protein product [Rangifer tarandus platyrhynchus]